MILRRLFVVCLISIFLFRLLLNCDSNLFLRYYFFRMIFSVKFVLMWHAYSFIWKILIGTSLKRTSKVVEMICSHLHKCSNIRNWTRFAKNYTYANAHCNFLFIHSFINIIFCCCCCCAICFCKSLPRTWILNHFSVCNKYYLRSGEQKNNIKWNENGAQKAHLHTEFWLHIAQKCYSVENTGWKWDLRCVYKLCVRYIITYNQLFILMLLVLSMYTQYTQTANLCLHLINEKVCTPWKLLKLTATTTSRQHFFTNNLRRSKTLG